MSDCHNLFKEFGFKIELSSSRKENLKQAREAIREKVVDYFSNVLKEKKPDFFIQGSFKMGTVISPIDGEVDIDYGIYLNNLPENINDWPTPETAQNWVKKAVENHTNKPPKQKENCVRVMYRNNYHVDLPIYGIYKGKTLIARRECKKWPESNPKDFTKWFFTILESHGEQMRQVVKYLKAWKDFKTLKFPSIAITILVANNFVGYQERNDISLYYTAQNLLNHLNKNRTVERPVYPYENVIEKLSESQIYKIINTFEDLIEDADFAIKENEIESASKKWEKHFGNRFPIVESSSSNINSGVYTSSILTIKNPSKSWGNNGMV